MKHFVLIAVLTIVAASDAVAQNASARALFSFEQFETNQLSRTGFRQTYDLHLDRALTGNTTLRLFFRGDDFRGDSGERSNSRLGTRQIEPGAELAVNLPTLAALIRNERYETQSSSRGQHLHRTLERSIANLTWAPVGLPLFRFTGQRNAAEDSISNVKLNDEALMASAEYAANGFSTLLSQNYARSVDPAAGFARKSNFQAATLAYTKSAASGRWSVGAEAYGQKNHLDEVAQGDRATSIPTPVAVARAFESVDDTPVDSRDHAPVELPSLIDGDVNTITGVSLGPTAVSFQNLILDVGHVDRIDQIRIIVRDEIRNPLRNGGGTVTWDVYTSADGNVWTLITSRVSFDLSLSYYAVDFNAVDTRWIKVVNFGVNADPTFVTEVQGYAHTTVGAGERRQGDQNTFAVDTMLTARPISRVTVDYTGQYTTAKQELSDTRTSTSNLDHLGSIQYDLTRSLAVRGQFTKRTVKNFDGRPADGATGLAVILDFQPTRRLHMSVDADRERQTIEGTPFVLETYGFHTTAAFLRSLLVTLEAGVQKQTMDDEPEPGTRDFANLTINAQLTPRLRMLLTGTLQEARPASADPATQVLGPERDNRVTSDFMWRTGRALTLGARFGWISGQAISGFTQRYHIEWFPFSSGSVSFGSSYDEDIDPILNRKARRLLCNPRWVVNRSATFDINYTAVSTTYNAMSNWQRSLFATLTLTR